MCKTTIANYTMAAGCIIIAAAFGFTALLLSEDNDIAAGVCMVIAQFLLLSATILGVDYKVKDIIQKNKMT